MQILILFFLIFLNGLLAMTEMAIASSKKARFTKQAQEGNKLAQACIKILENPNEALSTIQVGITSIALLNGMIGEAAFASSFRKILIENSVPSAIATPASLVLVIGLITYLSIVVGELLPKRIGQLYAEVTLKLMCGPLLLLSKTTKPFVLLLSGSTSALMKITGLKNNGQTGVTEEEIHALIQEGSENGTVEAHQHEMLKNVFNLDSRELASLMIPRSEIAWIDSNLDETQILEKITESAHSRFPVCAGSLDDLIGIIDSKTIMRQLLNKEPLLQETNLHPPVYVPQTLTGAELLQRFKEQSEHMALVVDEYGELEGMVTLHDLLEAVTGEFQPKEPHDAWIVHREDGSLLIDGTMPIAVLKDRLELRTLPEEGTSKYHTLAGLLMLQMAKVPEEGDKTEWENWHFEVVQMDNTRIDKVLAIKIGCLLSP